MMGRRIRSLGTVLLALLGAALLGGASAQAAPVAAAPRPVGAEVLLAALGDPGPVLGNTDVSYAEVMAGSGTPIPWLGNDGQYMQMVFGNYLKPSFTNLTAPTTPCDSTCNVDALVTPEGLYPMTGIKDLPLNTSVERGVEILHNQILTDLASNGPVGDDGALGVLGYSQSSVIASLEMQNLAAMSDAPGADELNFVLLGNPMNPNGGLLSRFAGLTVPSMGLNFYGATPADTLYPTDIYTIQYDGFAHFPKYPLNVLADLNAFAGIYYVHGTYPEQAASEFTQLATSDGYAGVTNYFMMPTADLPLLEPVRAIPLVGDPIAELLQPDLTVLVDLGYDDPFAATTFADVASPFGLFPQWSAIEALPGQLVDGTKEGLENFVNSLGGVSLADLNPLDLLSGAGAAGADPLDSVADFLPTALNALSDAAAHAYATLLPTADIANAVLTSMPAYLLDLSLDNLLDGDLLNAAGLPLAGAVGLATMAGGFEFLVLADAAQAVLADLTGLIGF
ncbi:PE-PPE domain-containing protein [Mycolicibacillus parakoreensis]|uniref:PE-PPE domain-containing protein n=1 Tax=Mycolicibacillus parakoreensis TaxID=1069221 RepID=A0ABY3TYG1_9MYCO|nr:PE-PPE domain-containing protein [Mycolicibacillus parakoreensis]MCV7316487.1 PE-PPE domain-containing protein [Mycolicibacillus parakoreensis]ULN52718.1 PE-PPE domain-containing protein [Mycolicibacillus parakoreensis]HLR99618.1 PE-PPE domain-containing protein [Mycolicibacillus parakoreensis]